jgi:hypothetical protein
MLYRDLATAIFPTVGIVCLASLVYQPFGQLLSELIPALTAYVLKMGLVVCALIGLGFLLAQLHVIFD